MKLFYIFMFMTLVLKVQFLLANPHQNMNSLTNEKKNSDETINNKSIDDYNLSLLRPHAPKTSMRGNYHYPYLQSVSPRFGLVLDTKEAKDEITKAFKVMYGIQYLFPRYRSPQLEVSADIIQDNYGQLTIAKRWTLNQRTAFRPYYKLGLTTLAVGKEGLATFINIHNYLARFSVGLEDYFRAPMSLRVELEFGVGTKDSFIYTTFGYSWGF